MKRLLLSVALILALLTVGIAGAQDEAILVVGHAEATDSLDPAHGYTQTTSIINQVTYDTLVTFPDADASSIDPRLATEWSVSDDSLTYTFMLREGVMFANGDAMTADDVVYSFNRLKNVQGTPSFLAADIVSVEASDATTVVITLAVVNPAFLANLTSNVFAVTNADEVMANGGTGETDDTAESYLNSTSAGSGPYVLESWDFQVETVLVRNENYWGDAPYFDRIIITNIPEAATQKVALESGEIDIALDLTSDQIADLEGNSDLTIYRGAGNIVHFLLMNADTEIGGPMSNPTVQLAVRYALDYAGYAALWGGVTPASPMAIGQATALGADQAFVRDLVRARELLTEAGYPDGFEVTLDYPIFSFQGVNMETNAQKIQADLAEVGIVVTLNPGELQVSLEQYRAGNQGFAYWFWGPDFLDPIDVLSFAPNGKVGGERTRWTSENADPELVALVERAQTETDPAGRVEVFTAIQEALQQSGPFAPFLQPNVQTAFRADIGGYLWHPQWLLDLSLLNRTM
ncbi:MAG: ABC transporter substrate-binding protein [Chloroflexota bacterium]|nr:ABC transporter substrate-binding protein [Chloroflexota bacterium]